MNKHIIHNAMITPDGTPLQSLHRHDFIQHTDANGEIYFLDGGNAYVRTSKNIEPAHYITIYSDDPHTLVRDYFNWGSYGKDGNEPLHWIPLDEMEDSHIAAILDNCILQDYVKEIFLNEVEYRKQNDLCITTP